MDGIYGFMLPVACYTIRGAYFNISDKCFICCSRGHADAEIEAVFAKYDLDGDRILDEEEQKKMQEDLEGQKVGCYIDYEINQWKLK